MWLYLAVGGDRWSISPEQTKRAKQQLLDNRRRAYNDCPDIWRLAESTAFNFQKVPVNTWCVSVAESSQCARAQACCLLS
jgi:hypothetical protein